MIQALKTFIEVVIAAGVGGGSTVPMRSAPFRG